MCRLINYKYSSSQIQLFSVSHCSLWLVAGVGSKCSGQFILNPAHPPGHQIKINLLILFIFKLSEYEDVSIIKMTQVKFSSFLRRIVSCCKGGGGKLCRAVYYAPHPPRYRS